MFINPFVFFLSCSNTPLAFSSKVCYIKFRDPSSVGVAQHLTNTVFIDRALIVVPCAEGWYLMFFSYCFNICPVCLTFLEIGQYSMCKSVCAHSHLCVWKREWNLEKKKHLIENYIEVVSSLLMDIWNFTTEHLENWSNICPL